MEHLLALNSVILRRGFQLPYQKGLNAIESGKVENCIKRHEAHARMRHRRLALAVERQFRAHP